jgi:hypothetical protein
MKGDSTMRRRAAYVISVCVLLAACRATPTRDLEASVQAAVAATQAAHATTGATASATQTAQPTVTATPLPTATRTPAPTPEPSDTPTQTPTLTPPPTATPSPAPSEAPEPTATLTPVPPTETAYPTQPPQDARGLVVNGYWVEGAPGPFAVGQDIWFGFDITNSSGNTLDYDALGAWVEGTGQFQKSWSFSSLPPEEHIRWRDHISIAEVGTHSLWLAIHFSDGQAALLGGPIIVSVE